MTENYPLKQAPQGYVPNCEAEHTADNIMHQRFKGGRVIGRWTDVTIKQWSDILYALENDFANQIQ